MSFFVTQSLYFFWQKVLQGYAPVVRVTSQGSSSASSFHIREGNHRVRELHQDGGVRFCPEKPPRAQGDVQRRPGRGRQDEGDPQGTGREGQREADPNLHSLRSFPPSSLWIG